MKRAFKFLLVACLLIQMAVPLGALAAGSRFTIANVVELANAITGKIQLTPEKEAEYNLTGSGELTIADLTLMAHEVISPNPGPQLIGEEKAIQIALAEVPGATSEHVRSCKLDTDDGVQVYDVDIYFDQTEYDYEIHAATGEIIEWSMERPVSPGQTGDIGEARAKEIVLELIPGATQSDIVEFKKDYENGVPVYEGEVRHNGMEFDFELSAANGELIKWSAKPIIESPAPTIAPVPTQTAAPTELLGEARARQIALDQVPGATESNIRECKLDYDDGVQVYDVEIWFENAEYEYTIDAYTGDILASSMDKPVTPGQAGDIGEQKAKEIVLAKIPGATIADFVEFKKDHEDGVAVYKGEVRYDGTEYDFELEAATGEIVEWSTDRYSIPEPIPTMPPQPSSSASASASALIGADRATQIALSNVKGATSANVRECKLDYDDGVQVYEVEIWFENTEYNYDVHATNGSIMSSHMDRPLPHPAPTGDIGEARAKQIVLDLVPGANATNFTEFKRDSEDGVALYEGKLRYNGTKYEFEIVAATGELVEWSTSLYGSAPVPSMAPTTTPRPSAAPTPSAAGILSASEARQIALSQVPGATEANIVKCKLDHDDGIQVYEIEIRLGNWEYEIEVNAHTGAVIDFDKDYDD